MLRALGTSIGRELTSAVKIMDLAMLFNLCPVPPGSQERHFLFVYIVGRLWKGEIHFIKGVNVVKVRRGGRWSYRHILSQDLRKDKDTTHRISVSLSSCREHSAPQSPINENGVLTGPVLQCEQIDIRRMMHRPSATRTAVLLKAL